MLAFTLTTPVRIIVRRFDAMAVLRKAMPEKVKVDSAHRFAGFDVYQQVIDIEVDDWLMVTPPAFLSQN